MYRWALVACALGLLLSGCGDSSTYTLMQMNLCLSGLAGCYDPDATEEAVERIRETDPDAVTINEACRSDVARNDAQCAELAALLERRAKTRTVIFGGDVNRRRACAPDGSWVRTDRSAGQAPGLQHVYGTSALRAPSADVVPATHTDHDVLLVRASR